jgi:two-component system response regulator PilR (NtrC family)
VDCGGLPEPSLEDDLFGHVKGAFAGALETKHGRFELAQGGTIFFDNVSTIGPALQGKLFRALQEREVTRLGHSRPIKADVRVMASSSVNLGQAVGRGAFREDLFYRLSVVPIHLPPLRERKDDIPLLVGHFLHKYSRKAGKVVSTISRQALAALEAYDWPGNVRELENLIERAIVLSKSKLITRSTLPPFLLDRRPEDEAVPTAQEKERSFKEQTQHYQKKVILNALRRAKGVQKQAARSLGLKPTTLNEMIKRLKIDVDSLS